MRILSALVVLAVWGALCSSALAQSALAAAGVDARRIPEALLTLRPEPELRELARQAAAVLELRTGQRVDIGDAPPPGIAEAVPAGHAALVSTGQGAAVTMILGAPGGRSVETNVDLSEQDVDSAARAVALALEALRDEATDLTRLPTPVPIEQADDGEAGDAPVAERAPLQVAGAADDFVEPNPYAVAARTTVAQMVPRVRDAGDDAQDEDFFTEVEPLLYLRAYAGASTASASLMSGLGAGVGVCVRDHCLVISGELPAYLSSPGRTDARYRYPTLTSGFYTRPFRWGPLRPGASIGFFTRLGQFAEDMGLEDDGLDTDLGARGTLELSLILVKGLDLMVEGGVDLTIDRLQLSQGDTLTDRVDRWSPWLQTAVRYRP